MKSIEEKHITIHGWMVSDLKLRGRELQAFALIYGFSQDERSEFYGSLQYVQQWLLCSKPTAIFVLDRLVQDGLIIRREGKQGTEANRYRVNFEVVKEMRERGKETLPVGVKKLYHTGKETLPDNTINSIDENIEKENVVFDENDASYLVSVISIESSAITEQSSPAPPRASKKKSEPDYKQLIIDVVDYLNEKARRNFEYETITTVRNIKAQAKKGRTIDDFRAVIDYKVSEWMNDDEFAKHLNPETLFGNKMEKYLQAARTVKHINTTSSSDPRHAAFLGWIEANYPALFRSSCRLFSLEEFTDYTENKTLTGLPYVMTNEQRRTHLMGVMAKLNGSENERKKAGSLWNAYLETMRQVLTGKTKAA